MLLGELIKGLGITPLAAGCEGVRICDVTEDSRTVLPGSLFVARAGGKSDGRRFIGAALSAGAVAVLAEVGSERPERLPIGVAWLVAADVGVAEARLGERFFGNPGRRLDLVGVTGTNGKTTVSSLVYQLLNSAKRRCGLIGTVMVDDGKGPVKATMTTPPALELSLALSRMVEAGYKAAALEVSSHALDQKRAAGLEFDVAVFTNLTGDHLDYHGTMENYGRAKAGLFESLGVGALAIVNADDPAHEWMIRGCPARVLRCLLGARAVTGGECAVEVVSSTIKGARLVLRGPWGEVSGRVGLMGSYNAMNCLEAVASAHELGLSRERIEAALPGLSAPAGRLERVGRAGGGVETEFAVFVDYAHTDDALAKALRAVRPLVVEKGASLRVVFGCGGDKDRTKRPRMGRVACELADCVYITSDNPRTEDPRTIIREILAGVQTEACLRVHEDQDRRASIFRAVRDCRAGDVLLIAGKGHEDCQILPDGRGGVRRIDFDDRAVACEAMGERGVSGEVRTVAPGKRENVKP